MRLICLLMLMTLASGCATALPTGGDALCDATRAQRAAVARDVAATSDDALAVSAAGLVVLIDAGCAR
jgi:hypothetical protein